MVKPNEKFHSCDCDMRYIREGDSTETIKAFFQAHPFMLGFLTGFIFKKGTDTFAKILQEVAEENYRKKGGWGNANRSV